MRLGIDPGIGGALALLSRDYDLLAVIDMPVMAGTGKRQQVNAAELSKIIDSWQRESEGDQLIAFIEQVSARPGQGVSSMFSFGDSFGTVRGVLAAKGIPLLLVTPQAWKKRAGLIGSEKDRSRTVAQQMFPSADLARKKDIGRADALLIARYGSKNDV
ncbi:MAG: crossover junction endodeoxyribonuclease [Candidatus Marinimicrobia bacterium]|nr:crossover junction endodeoxyribonuclease [Candidatus Neomarinimicrobiota bacterium]